MTLARIIRLALVVGAFLIFASTQDIRRANAEDYTGVSGGPPGGPAAALFDPTDPLPQIQCRHDCGCRQDCGCRHDCGGCEPRCGERRWWHRPHEGREDGDGRTIVVDCSHQHRNMAPSIQWALKHSRPNGRILVLPPGEGMTCREHLSIDLPVTIATFGGGHSAVIQAPDNEPCAEANIPLGDSLVFDGITFIARGRDAPCIRVRAGHVVVRNSEIDSRNTNWAFDVLDSGELTVERSKIETDGSGVRAVRAKVHLHGLDIDMSPNRADAALQLQRTDGEIQGGEIVGGRWGVLASPGAHGLSISELRVRNANTGVEFVAGGQGLAHADKLSLTANRNSIVIGPFVDAEVSDSVITKSQDGGVVTFGADARISANKIVDGRIGVRIARFDEFKWDEIPFRPSDDPPAPGRPEITGNIVANVGQANVFADEDAPARIIGNTFYAPHNGACFAGDKEHVEYRGNDCRTGSGP